MTVTAVECHGEFAYPETLAHYPDAAYDWARSHRNCTPGDGETAESCSALRQLMEIHEQEESWTWTFPKPLA